MIRESRHFEVAMKFRRSFHRGDKTSLCQAIALSRGFESTDPRDAIFSLLALCYDRSDLVPTPNYFQPIEEVVTNLTRALISKYKYLDFILINKTKPTGSDLLPSWAPNWMSEFLPFQAYDLVDGTVERAKTRFTGFYLTRNSLGHSISSGSGKVLRTRGIATCQIVAITSTTNPMEVSEPGSSRKRLLTRDTGSRSKHSLKIQVLQRLHQTRRLHSIMLAMKSRKHFCVVSAPIR